MLVLNTNKQTNLMKYFILSLSLALCLFSFSQTSPNYGITLKEGKVKHPKQADYTEHLAKLMFDYNDGQENFKDENAMLFLHKTNMDFTITDEKVVIFYNATEKQFYLNQLFLNNSDLIPEGSALTPENETDSNSNIILTWNIEGKKLVVILWREDFESSLSYTPKHKKKHKK